MSAPEVEQPAGRFRETAEAAWRWVLAQVRYDDEGIWIPETVPVAGEPEPPPPAYRDGMHSGTGGLAHALDAVARQRDRTEAETRVADAVGERIRASTATSTDCTWFDGLVSDIGVLTRLRQPGVPECVARLDALGDEDGWPRYNDATLGVGAIVDGGLDAGDPAGDRLAGRAADRLLAEAEPTGAGLNWLFEPRRYAEGEIVQMPNWSHGVAGVAAVLARAGHRLDRTDLVDAARRGAEHLVTLADPSDPPADGGFVVPRRIPAKDGEEVVTWNWCHGPPGTSQLFAALDRAGVTEVAGQSPREWERRCLHATMRSGVPERLRPGFWDNDGRCCGTAGVGQVFLDAWARDPDPAYLAFAVRLGEVLLDRALVTDGGEHARWRFVEHRNPDPLLPPGVGWMQGAAGIAGFLFELALVVD